MNVQVINRGGPEVNKMLSAATTAAKSGPQDAIKETAQHLATYAEYVTHRHTGTLAGAHRDAYEGLGGAAAGYVYIDPSTTDPEGDYAADYGPYEEERGASHAFYERTVEEEGDFAIERGLQVVVRKIW